MLHCERDDSDMLTSYERETIVNFNDEDDYALVYTAQRKMLRQFRAEPDFLEIETGEHDGTEWARFEVPKHLVRITVKRTRTLTPEQRDALSVRMRAMKAANHTV